MANQGFLVIKSAVIVSLALLSGCATIVNGTSQTVTVSTAPPGATCTVDRTGMRIGAIAATPGSLRIDKSGKDLSVTCTKEGYQTASVSRSPAFSGATFGNIIAGGLIGIVVDASSGANYHYPEDIRVEMASVPALPIMTAPMAAAPSVTEPENVVRVRSVVMRQAKSSMVQPIRASATSPEGMRSTLE